MRGPQSYGSHGARMLQGYSREIEVSRKLLLELSTQDPTVIQCLSIVKAICLTQGVRCIIDDEPCSVEFQEFVDKYYTPFCIQSLHAMFTYGFIPWYVRKTLHTPSGESVKKRREEIPTVVSPGTFTWQTTLTRTLKTCQEPDPGIVCYQVYSKQVNI